MKQVLRYLVIIPAVLWMIGIGTVWAVNHILAFTAAQDTIIVAKVIPAYNRQHCSLWGRASGCTSANLVTGGCVVKNVCQAIGLPAGTPCTNLSTLNVESCVIYTADATGEDLMLQELANKDLVSTYMGGQSFAGSDFRSGFRAASQANQDAACVAAGLAAGCDGP